MWYPDSAAVGSIMHAACATMWAVRYKDVGRCVVASSIGDHHPLNSASGSLSYCENTWNVGLLLWKDLEGGGFCCEKTCEVRGGSTIDHNHPLISASECLSASGMWDDKLLGWDAPAVRRLGVCSCYEKSKLSGHPVDGSWSVSRRRRSSGSCVRSRSWAVIL